jgi:hypothetical protein
MMATMVRDTWTDERLDDLNHRVDDGFRELRADLRALNGNMQALNRTMTEQFAAQHRATVQLFGVMFATMMVGFLGVIATILSHG